MIIFKIPTPIQELLVVVRLTNTQNLYKITASRQNNNYWESHFYKSRLNWSAVSSSQIKFVNTTNSPAMVFKYKLINYSSLSSFSTNSSGELDVFGHDSDSLGVDGAQVGIFEQSYEVSFTGLLKKTRC